VELHLIRTENLSTQFGHHLAIHRDDTCLDELIGLATAADTRIGKELVQAQGFVGIIIEFFILYALLETVLCIRIIVGRMLTGSLLVRCAIRLAITTLLGTLTITALRTLAITTLALLIATLWALTVVITGLITALALRTLAVVVTGLVTTLTLRALTIVATGLIATLALLTITTLLTLLIATTVVITGTEATTLGCTTLKTSSETLGTEAAFIIVVIMVIGTLEIRALACMDTRTR